MHSKFHPQHPRLVDEQLTEQQENEALTLAEIHGFALCVHSLLSEPTDFECAYYQKVTIEGTENPDDWEAVKKAQEMLTAAAHDFEDACNKALGTIVERDAWEERHGLWSPEEQSFNHNQFVRLTTFPAVVARRAKRLGVTAVAFLLYIAAAEPSGRDITDQELCELLGLPQNHLDTLREEMVEQGWITRTRCQYHTQIP